MKQHLHKLRAAVSGALDSLDELSATQWLLLLGVLGLALFSVGSYFSRASPSQGLSAILSATALPNVPAPTPAPLPKVQLAYVTIPGCPDCFDPRTLKASIASLGLDVASERTVESNSTEGARLVQIYSLGRLPTLIVLGDAKNSGAFASEAAQVGTFAPDGAFVFRTIPPVYYNVSNKSFAGRVEMMELSDSACAECWPVREVVAALNSSPMKISAFRRVEAGSAEGKMISELYNVSRAPSLLLSRGVFDYPAIADALLKEGFKANGMVVYSPLQPVYETFPNLSKRGLFNATILRDSACSACYNASFHEQVLSNLGVVAQNVAYLDYNGTAGSALVQKYNVTSVPSFVLTGDVGAYGNLMKVWPVVGSVETDGAYVFRNQSVFTPPLAYLDTRTGSVVSPPGNATS